MVLLTVVLNIRKLNVFNKNKNFKCLGSKKARIGFNECTVIANDLPQAF